MRGLAPRGAVVNNVVVNNAPAVSAGVINARAYEGGAKASTSAPGGRAADAKTGLIRFGGSAFLALGRRLAPRASRAKRGDGGRGTPRSINGRRSAIGAGVSRAGTASLGLERGRTRGACTRRKRAVFRLIKRLGGRAVMGRQGSGPAARGKEKTGRTRWSARLSSTGNRGAVGGSSPLGLAGAVGRRIWVKRSRGRRRRPAF